MLSAAARSRIAVVLVGARNPQNIGAAARAMQDFGFSDLRFVNEYTVPLEAAQAEAAIASGEVKSAVGAGHILRAGRSFASVAEAVADCTLVVGTTAIGERALAEAPQALAEAAPALREAAAPNSARVALLFGSEKTGLTNPQLSFCQRLVTIPMFAPLGADGSAERHLSMNLGQSVAVCLYELVREGFEGARDLPSRSEASVNGEDRERLTQLLLDAMQATGYARRFPANAREPVVRRLAQSLAVDAEQAQTWMGFLKMMARSANAREE
jgi:tRNA/rRNA methyltransferase